MGDVVRDVPRQISETRHSAQIVVPSYSRLHTKGIYQMNLEFKFKEA